MTIAAWDGPRWNARTLVDDSCDVCFRKHNGDAVMVSGANAGEYGDDVYYYCRACVLRMAECLGLVMHFRPRDRK